MKAMEALAIVCGHVEEELLIRNEYLAAENNWASTARVCWIIRHWCGFLF